MLVAVGTPVGEAGPGALAGLWGLDQLVVQPTRRYRRRFGIELPTGGLAEALTLLGSTALTVSFLSRDFDALAAGAPEAVAGAGHGGDLAVSLPVARRFLRVRLASPQPGDRVAAYRFDGDAVSEDAVDSGAHGAQGASLDVTDRQLILRRVNADASAPLGLADIDEIVLRVEPQNPRLSIAVIGDPEGPRALPLPAEADPATEQALGAQLAAALEDQISRFQGSREPQHLPDPLGLELIAEADSPCRLRIHGFAIGYRLRRASFPDGAPKQVLRFKGTRRETRSLAVTVPGAIAAASARLRLAGDLGGRAGPQEGEATTGEAQPPEPPAAASKLGVAVTGERPVAARMTLPAASAIAAGLTELAVVVPPEAVLLSLRRDQEGEPGELLAESLPLRPAAGPPALHRFAFTPAAVVPSGRVWAGLQTQGGRLVWMLAPAQDGLVLELHGRLWRGVGAAAGMTPTVLLPPLDGSAADRGGAAGAEIDGQPLVMTRDGSDTLLDLAALITARAATAPAGTEVGLSILVSSAVRGVVTAFPPTVDYDLV